jgi:pimeloyl-ACP methyl ester carboxylesterase
MNSTIARLVHIAGAAFCTLLFVGLASAAAHAPCPSKAQCGSITVPLDRTNPSAGTIDIAYELVPRTDLSRPALGTIVPNPGGPGQTTIGSAGLYLNALAPLRTRRDLLLVDPRGTGQSGAITCPSLANEDPLTLDATDVGRLCGADLGPSAGLYGSAAVADDIDAVRAALGLDQLDLWGDSYGTFLMTVYAARHPEHVRSIVLDGAFPVTSDPWGRDVLRGTRHVIRLVCHRSGRCSGKRVLNQLETLATRLRRHPVNYAAHTPIGSVRLTLDEEQLANVTFGGGHPEVYGFLPVAVSSALHGDYALMKRLVTASRVNDVGDFFINPALLSTGAAYATSCHDYPRPYDLAASPADRHAQYESALAALPPDEFSPFSGDAWLSTSIDAGPKCLDWPADPLAGSPLEGRGLPDVPVLVQSGDLDSNTPVEQGRAAAAQFPHSTFAIVANAGHTPDLQPCGVAMAIDFVKHLQTDPNRCRRAGAPPAVVGRPAARAGQLPELGIHGTAAVRRAVAVALATIADERGAVAYAGATGQLDALRGGTYVVRGHRAKFVSARVVVDAWATGAQTTRGSIARTRLQLGGHGIAPSRLTVRSAGRATRITGTVGGREVAMSVTTG